MGNPDSSLRILLVDDSLDTIESMQALLALDGHEIRTAHDGAAALAIAGEFAPHAVILDLGLPVMDGYEVARRLRALGSCRSSLLIALTGYSGDEERASALAAGFDEHLAKPADPTLLSRRLERLRADVLRA